MQQTALARANDIRIHTPMRRAKGDAPRLRRRAAVDLGEPNTTRLRAHGSFASRTSYDRGESELTPLLRDFRTFAIPREECDVRRLTAGDELLLRATSWDVDQGDCYTIVRFDGDVVARVEGAWE